MNIIETTRLHLRRLNIDDSAFILELLNDAAWIKFIGDKGVRTLADAHAYILNGPVAMYTQWNLGLYAVELNNHSSPIGICGLLKRSPEADVDIGYAFLPQYRGKGYAHEAASAVLSYGKTRLKLPRIIASTQANNQASIKLLQDIGLHYEKTQTDTSNGSTIMLFACEFPTKDP